jgi:hypothetical protein
MEQLMTAPATMDVRLRRIADHLMALTDAAAFSPSSIGAKLLPHLFVLDIESETSNRAALLRIRLVGTALDDAFRRPLRGHTLDEYIHGPRGKEVIASFHHCADSREPIWMRQVVHIRNKVPRFVEGVAVYLKPERIYGGLVVGECAGLSVAASFERIALKVALPTS